MQLIYRRLTPDDGSDLHRIYSEAAGSENPGLARSQDEITRRYIEDMLSLDPDLGFTVGAYDGSSIVGAIHASRLTPRQFDHVVGNIAIAVSARYQGRGIGAGLFGSLFSCVRESPRPVARFELFARSGNIGALRLYEKLGFVREGVLVGRVLLGNGVVEDDVVMGISPWS